MTECRSPLRRATAALALIVAIALPSGALSGCGQTTRVKAGATVSIALREYRITPQKVSTADGSLTLQITNDGRLTHDLVIASGDGVRQAASAPIAPGQTDSLVTSLAPGTYVMSSSRANDKALGTDGTLVVG